MVKLLSDMLRAGGIEDFTFEAECLMEHMLGKSWKIDSLLGRLSVTDRQSAELCELASRRIKGEPLQYILGRWEFYGLELSVGEGVLIPRQDTETLVETALELLGDSPKVVDLCSGTGCIPIALSQKIKGSYIAVEKYDSAYKYLLQNTQRYGGVTPVMGDVLDEALAQSFDGLDLITANPPYLTKEDMESLQLEVKSEPETALYGGDDGLYFYREISRIWKRSLRSGGHIIFEVGVTQGVDVAQILKSLGYTDINLHLDYTDRVRCVSAKCP